MKNLTYSLLIVMALTTMALAQAKPTDKFAWTQDDGATATVAGTYRYELELDGVVQPTPLAGVTCTGAARPWTCQAPIPAVTPSQHSARIRAVDAASPEPINWLFGDWSDPLVFTMRATPAKPGGLRIIPATP